MTKKKWYFTVIDLNAYYSYGIGFMLELNKSKRVHKIQKINFNCFNAIKNIYISFYLVSFILLLYFYFYSYRIFVSYLKVQAIK